MSCSKARCRGGPSWPHACLSRDPEPEGGSSRISRGAPSRPCGRSPYRLCHFPPPSVRRPSFRCRTVENRHPSCAYGEFTSVMHGGVRHTPHPPARHRMNWFPPRNTAPRSGTACRRGFRDRLVRCSSPVSRTAGRSVDNPRAAVDQLEEHCADELRSPQDSTGTGPWPCRGTGVGPSDGLAAARDSRLPLRPAAARQADGGCHG